MTKVQEIAKKLREETRDQNHRNFGWVLACSNRAKQVTAGLISYEEAKESIAQYIFS